MATWTPWGPSQASEKIAPGITFYSTASHGGVKLSEARQREMPEALRLEKPWYEEDCEFARVVLAFPDHFSEKQLETAQSTLKDYYPKAYENFYGVELKEGESRARDEALYQKRHKDDLMAVTAFRIGDFQVKVFATPGGDRRYIRTDKEQVFVVPKEEYDKHINTYKANCPFVIDPSRHEPFELFDKRMLELERRDVGDELINTYDFGCQIVDMNGWKQNGDRYTRKIFLEDANSEHEASVKVDFVVSFEEGDSSVLDVYAIDNQGNIIGRALENIDSPGTR